MGIGWYLNKRSPGQPQPRHVEADTVKSTVTAKRSQPSEIPAAGPTPAVSANQPQRMSRDRDARMASLKERILDATIQARLPDYQKLLSELGVDDAHAEKLLNHLKSIWSAKIEMANAGSSAVLEEAKYVAELKALLGPRYADYTAFESASRSRNEVALINEHLQSQNLPALSTAEQSAVRDLIQKFGAYSSRTNGDIGAGGALGEMPGAAFGEEAHKRAQADRDHLAAAAASALSEAKDAGLDPAVVTALRDYYGTQLGQADRFLNRAKDPVAREIEVWQSALARLEKRPSANAEEITRIQQKIDQLRQAKTTTAPTP